jgi:aminoglycoside phosphotransferase (APT) family kinase protein
MSGVRAAGVEAAVADAARALGLERPEVTPLDGGVANRSFRLREGARDFVLRVASGVAAGLGASADAELAMQSLAADAGLAPAVVLADAGGRYFVSRFAAGRNPSESDMRDARLLRRLGEWIARLHALGTPPGLAAVDFGARAEILLVRSEERGGDAFIGRLRQELARRRAALPAPARIAPCHHDLHRRNLLDDGERIVAVDWEYAGPGDPAADLASCIGYHALDARSTGALLEGYGSGGAGLRARVAALSWIFDCLWYGWNAAAADEGLAPDSEEQSRLAARLAR